MASCEWNLPLDIYRIHDLMGIHGQDEVVLVFHYSPSHLIAIFLQFHAGNIIIITGNKNNNLYIQLQQYINK